MSKVFSIVYNSRKKPEKLSMYSGLHKTFEEAKKKGIERVVKDYGDISWVPLLQSLVEIEDINIYDKNSVLNIIVKKKDRKLFNAMKPYITKNEILLVNDKLKKHAVVK